MKFDLKKLDNYWFVQLAWGAGLVWFTRYWFMTPMSPFYRITGACMIYISIRQVLRETSS